MIHLNSIASYRRLAEFQLAERKEMIIGLLVQYGPLTDREVADKLGFVDMNAVRPRITELLQLGWIVETGSIYDMETERHVRMIKYVGHTVGPNGRS